MLLPTFKSEDKDFMLLQTRWAAILNSIIGNPSTNPTILKDVVLDTGVNVVNHRLGRLQQGWIVMDQDSAATIYRSAPFNTLTLTLTVSAPVTVTLGIF